MRIWYDDLAEARDRLKQAIKENDRDYSRLKQEVQAVIDMMLLWFVDEQVCPCCTNDLKATEIEPGIRTLKCVECGWSLEKEESE